MNKLPLRAVMFDLDGTLLDTAPDFVVVVNQLLLEQQRPVLPDATIRAGVSNGSKALIRLAFGIDESNTDFEPLRQRLLTLYLQHIAVHTKPFPGIEPLLEKIAEHQLAWGIATNKPEAYTTPLMDALNIRPAPASVICPEHVQRSKPDPESMFLAGKHLGCEPQQIIFIGDHKRDIDCGRDAGSITIAAAYGYVDEGDDPTQWNADYCVNHADEIWPIIQQYL
ncbi:HAD-superfamily hydrolase, subfamily IA, variant 3 [Cellvibrio japonicus Ueda107]|uniref:HAD-superfamily hydrolase, subfamily IA, variant 3 n=2 Tax=Cellvibrio japonicus TaxID=155077 RepID=B3PII9_CELJU|nr:HAD-IA family hydrolase [Cellvibrio japonicus]ACE85151.1 HAD-superfamily hydrolase, subfamily IA, variant 3 [Cellvibrio japonicus Ueda107]